MKILLERVSGHLEMSVEHNDTVENAISWSATISDMVEELKDRQGVKRMSYNTWHWDLRRLHEAEEYITYFYLKHE